MIKAIFWDNDGILVDTEPLYMEATREILAGAGITFTDDQYRDLFLVQSRGAWHLAAERGYSADEIAALRERRNTLYGERLGESRLVIDGVRSVLNALRGKYVMGIVTSSRQDHFDIIHRNSGLLGYFDFVLTAADFVHSKPNPEPYLRAITRSGVAADACIAIEDSVRGLTAAKAAGIRCVVVPTSLTQASDFAAADRILERLADIHGVLDAESGSV
jgi:HAD superfamily hydrolase (TIGR01509 family)